MTPETRYIEVYEQGTGRLLRHDPYEVSDEELTAEAHQAQLDADTIRATQLLATSPAVITQPETWELMRIIGRRLSLSAEVINDSP